MGRIQPTTDSPVRRALNECDSTTLFEMAEQVDELLVHPGYAVVNELLEKGREAMLKDLIHGGTKDEAGYARQTGYISGLEGLSDVIDAVHKTAATRRTKLEREAEAESRSREEVAA